MTNTLDLDVEERAMPNCFQSIKGYDGDTAGASIRRVGRERTEREAKNEASPCCRASNHAFECIVVRLGVNSTPNMRVDRNE